MVLPKSELNHCDSDFLCSLCYNLLYLNVRTEKEICINPSCKMCPEGLSFHSVSGSDAEKELRAKFVEIIKNFQVFSKEFFYWYLQDKRAIACDSFFSKNRLPLNHLLGTNYLMVALSKNKSWGTSCDKALLEFFFNEFVNEFSNLIFVEDIDSRNYLISKNEHVFILKFLFEIKQLFIALGIADESQIDENKVDSFYSIDKDVSIEKISDPYDFEKLYKKYFFLVKILQQVFQLRYFISKIHKYSGKTTDFATLLSLWKHYSKPKSIEKIDEEKLKAIYEGVKSKNSSSGIFEEFKKEYSSGEKLAPILIFDDKSYMFDYFSLLLLLLYLFSLNKKIEGTQTLSGFQTLDDQRQKASANFEKAIRDFFRHDGYVVYPQKDDEKFIRTFNGQTHEFDCIAVNESKKNIIIIDAKYEDISPSSKAAINLINQEILDDDTGIIQYAIVHENRVRFVIDNFDKMSFDSKNPSDYTLISMIVTKHTPIIKKYKNVHILSYEQFKKYGFSE